MYHLEPSKYKEKYGEGADNGDAWEVAQSKAYLTGDAAKQIFPYEYWDTSLRIEDADRNGERFVEYCAEMGIKPRFSGAGAEVDAKLKELSEKKKKSKTDLEYIEKHKPREIVVDKSGRTELRRPGDFTGMHGYWKTLIDHKMYNNDGTYHIPDRIDIAGISVDPQTVGQDESGNDLHQVGDVAREASQAKYGVDSMTKAAASDAISTIL